MREVKIRIYRHHELSEPVRAAVKKRLLERWHVEGTDLRCADIKEVYQYELESLGYPTNNICWSLGYSQGDGMAFYGPCANLALLRDRLLAGEAYTTERVLLGDEVLQDLSFTIVRNRFGYHYSHPRTMVVDVAWEAVPPALENNTAVMAALYALRDAVRQDIQAVSRRLEREGYAIVEYEWTEEFFTDRLAFEDLYFLADGTEFDLRNAA
jgi:hypothetical protein